MASPESILEMMQKSAEYKFITATEKRALFGACIKAHKRIRSGDLMKLENAYKDLRKKILDMVHLLPKDDDIIFFYIDIEVLKKIVCVFYGLSFFKRKLSYVRKLCKCGAGEKLHGDLIPILADLNVYPPNQVGYITRRTNFMAQYYDFLGVFRFAD